MVMQTNKAMVNPPHQKRHQREHRHSPLRSMPDEISTQQTTAQQSNPQRVRAKNTARTCAILPRGGGYPNQTVVAQGHQKQTICIMAGPHMAGGQQELPRVRRNIKMPWAQDEERITIDKSDTPNRRQRRQRRSHETYPPST